jgi:tetratricopeptide (TPR) repeat protein
MNEAIALATTLVEAQRGQPPMAQAHPLIAVYLELVSLYLNPEGEDIQYLLANKLFRQHSSMLTIQEQRLLLAHLISIGVRQFILENHTIGPELLSLYRWALDNGLLVVNHFMTEITFLNISALAVDCGDLEFAADFIQQWNSLVVEQYRNDAVHAALGLLCFAKGEFDQAHENIRDIVTNRPPYNLLIRSLLLKLYFERLIRDKGQFDVFRDYAVAFERYIVNQDLVGTRQEAWLNYVRSALSLANFWVKEGWLDANDKAHFRAELEAMRFVCSKNWILQKIEEMK